MNELFFELIRVAIGTQQTLSRQPSKKEWRMLYAMAEKQSLIGICFAGIRKLGGDADEGFANIGMPEMLYLTWMGTAASIQMRNEQINKQCVELQERLAADGFRSCILKGQGVGSLYGDELSVLRQSGDIDVWIMPNEGVSADAHFKNIIGYAKQFGPIDDFNKQHVSISFFNDTEVEVHFTPSLMCNPFINRRLQKWFEDNKDCKSNSKGLIVPSKEFNLVYLLQHCYNHLLFEGVGLRQLMDYYFVLKALSNSPLKGEDLKKTLSSLNMLKFASAVMWVIAHVFANDNVIDYETLFFGIEHNEKEGRFLLEEIISGGNFGKYGQDGIMESHAKGKVAYFMARMRRNWRYLRHYPHEVVWGPYFMVTHYIWKNNTIINDKPC